MVAVTEFFLAQLTAERKREEFRNRVLNGELFRTVTNLSDRPVNNRTLGVDLPRVLRFPRVLARVYERPVILRGWEREKRERVEGTNAEFLDPFLAPRSQNLQLTQPTS